MTTVAHKILDDLEHLLVQLRRELRLQASPTRWLQLAQEELGVAEVVGPQHSERVLEYLASCEGLPEAMAGRDETPWCSAFVNWVMTNAGLTGTGRANARSWTTYGHGLTTFAPGAIVVLSRGENPSHGHVGFYAGLGEPGSIRLLGGNQSNQVSVAEYATSRVVAIRWPAGEPSP